jgi:hypothetical protein
LVSDYECFENRRGFPKATSKRPAAFFGATPPGLSMGTQYLLETLERFAAALDIPLYRLFYSGEGDPGTPHLTPRRSLEELSYETGPGGGEARLLLKLKGLVGKMAYDDWAFVLALAHKLAAR